MSRELPSIYQFDDYRIYLQAVFAARKRRVRRYSLGGWAARLNLRSSSGLIMILKGDRNPSAALSERIIQDLALRTQEAEYFRDLISYEKANDDSHMKVILRDRLARRRPAREFRAIESGTYKSIANWYYKAILELCDLPGFREDADWIQSRLVHKVTKSQILEALATLENLQLLRRDENNNLRYNGSTMTTFDVPSEGLREYHSQVLDLCKDALKVTSVQDREISGITFTCKKEDLEKLKTQIRDLIHNVVQISEAPHDSVYQLEIACIPLTKDQEK